MRGKSATFKLCWIWLAALDLSAKKKTIPLSRVYAAFLKNRKPWKVRTLEWEKYIRDEKRFADDPIPHMPSEFFTPPAYQLPFAHQRRPWKKENTYQVIRRLEHS